MDIVKPFVFCCCFCILYMLTSYMFLIKCIHDLQYYFKLLLNLILQNCFQWLPSLTVSHYWIKECVPVDPLLMKLLLRVNLSQRHLGPLMTKHASEIPEFLFAALQPHASSRFWYQFAQILESTLSIWKTLLVDYLLLLMLQFWVSF